MKEINWSSSWTVERGTSCFYITNNGWHLLKTCGDSIEDQRIANSICANLNDHIHPTLSPAEQKAAW